MTPLEFLSQLWQEKPEDHHILIWTHPDKRSRWFTSVPAAAEYVASVNGGRDVYVGVGLAGKDHGPTHRCASEEITGLTGMWSDLDLLSDAHSKKALPQTVQQALTILPASMPPTIIYRDRQRAALLVAVQGALHLRRRRGPQGRGSRRNAVAHDVAVDRRDARLGL